MQIAIMQPYFLPYIGYFQLIESVDLFIVYDNIKYTKKGWINRNRMFQNGNDVMFSLPLKKDSDFLNVSERELSMVFKPNKLLNQIAGAYRRSPFFDQAFPVIEQVLLNKERNLFNFLYHSIDKICEYLGIKTTIRYSSQITIDHNLKSQDKVLALCEEVNATTYVNAIGGMALYSKDAFSNRGIELKFLKSKPFEYNQLGYEFIPWLSIIDVMMFNSLSSTRNVIKSNYELI